MKDALFTIEDHGDVSILINFLLDLNEQQYHTLFEKIRDMNIGDCFFICKEENDLRITPTTCSFKKIGSLCAYIHKFKKHYVVELIK